MIFEGSTCRKRQRGQPFHAGDVFDFDGATFFFQLASNVWMAGSMAGGVLTAFELDDDVDVDVDI